MIQSALQSPKPLDVPLGRDISGNVRLCDITKMPHMLIAGQPVLVNRYVLTALSQVF